MTFSINVAKQIIKEIKEIERLNFFFELIKIIIELSLAQSM